MTPDFDPYSHWLGIPRQSMPVNHYSLLGLKPFEPDRQAIAAAAAQRMNLMRQHAAGPHAAAARQLFQELMAARQCLMDPGSRAAYDAQLRANGAEGGPRPSSPAKGESAPRARAAAPATPSSRPAARSSPPPKAPPAAAASPPLPPPAPAPLPAHGGPPPAPPPPPPGSPPPATTGASGPVADWSGIEEIASQSYAPRSAGGAKSKRGGKRPEKRSSYRRNRDQVGESDSPGKKKFWIIIGAAATVLLVVGGVGGFVYLTRGKKPVATASVAASEAPAKAFGIASNSSDAVAAESAASDVKSAPASAGAAASAKDAPQNAAVAAPSGDAAPEAKPETRPEFVIFDRAETEGATEPIEKALAGGLNIESRDAAGRTLLRRAAMGGHLPLIEFLINKHADVNTADDVGETPLMSAAQRGDTKLVSLLLSSGAKPNACTLADEEHHTGGLAALHVAARAGQTEVVQLLLEEKADPDVRSASGATPLMIACWQRQAQIAQELLQRHASATAKDLDGQNVLMYAVQGGDKAVVKLILFRDEVSVKGVSRQGATALGIALEAKADELVEMIREAAKQEAPALGL